MLCHGLQERRRHLPRERRPEMTTAQRLNTWPGGNDPDDLRLVSNPGAGWTHPIQLTLCFIEALTEVQLEQVAGDGPM
jgi:hypothetical protein